MRAGEKRSDAQRLKHNEEQRLRMTAKKAELAARDPVAFQNLMRTNAWLTSEWVLREKYGMDGEDWARLYENQDGLCWGCERKLELDPSTHVDHDHKSNRVRGLLCLNCNVAVAHALDNPDTLRRLAEYLEANDNYAPGHIFYSDQDPREIGSSEW